MCGVFAFFTHLPLPARCEYDVLNKTLPQEEIDQGQASGHDHLIATMEFGVVNCKRMAREFVNAANPHESLTNLFEWVGVGRLSGYRTVGFHSVCQTSVKYRICRSFHVLTVCLTQTTEIVHDLCSRKWSNVGRGLH